MNARRLLVGLGALCMASIGACGRDTAPTAAREAALAATRPDLNGTWAHSGGGVLGLEYVQPEELPDGSVCLGGCGGSEEGDDANSDEAAGDDPGPDTPPSDGPPFPAPEPTFPRYKPEVAARVKELSDAQVDADTVLRCVAPGVPRIGPPRKIVQTANEVVFLYDDYNGNFFRIVPINGRGHRTDVPTSYLGDAVGHFEEDTLVVETVNFNEHTWLTDNGAFHTKDLRVIERLRRVGDVIEYEAVAHDPAVLTEPWVARTQKLWLDDRDLEEVVPCQERDLPFMRDKSYHANPR
jgi:hypothetical protein